MLKKIFKPKQNKMLLYLTWDAHIPPLPLNLCDIKFRPLFEKTWICHSLSQLFSLFRKIDPSPVQAFSRDCFLTYQFIWNHNAGIPLFLFSQCLLFSSHSVSHYTNPPASLIAWLQTIPTVFHLTAQHISISWQDALGKKSSGENETQETNMQKSQLQKRQDMCKYISRWYSLSYHLDSGLH